MNFLNIRMSFKPKAPDYKFDVLISELIAATTDAIQSYSRQQSLCV